MSAGDEAAVTIVFPAMGTVMIVFAVVWFKYIDGHLDRTSRRLGGRSSAGSRGMSWLKYYGAAFLLLAGLSLFASSVIYFATGN